MFSPDWEPRESKEDIVTIPRAQYDALMAAAEGWFMAYKRESPGTPIWALADIYVTALIFAGVKMGEGRY